MRNGYAWIGVSAQRVGVDHLRRWSPARYGSLDVTHAGAIEDDALSYDIFSAVGRIARGSGDADVLGGLKAGRVFATGHSQSAGRLSVYLNNVHPRDPVFDAVVVHGGGRRIRQDQDVKVWKLMAEGDMVGRAATRQPDTDTFRSWEVAGSSHVDIFFWIESSRVAALAAGRNPATAETANVWATLPGTTDEKIVIVAHRDGWFEGANDNAAGVATLVGLAEYFAALPRERLRRTIQFVGTPGHHNQARVGVAWIEDNADAVLDGTALLINAEHTGAVDVYRLGNSLGWSDHAAAFMWGVSGSPGLRQIATGAYEAFGVSTLIDPGGPVGEIRGLEDRVPSVWLIDAPEYFHSDHETAATVPAEGTEAVTRVFASIIDRVNEREIEDLQPR